MVSKPAGVLKTKLVLFVFLLPTRSPREQSETRLQSFVAVVVAVKEARLKEIKSEILNSEKLKVRKDSCWQSPIVVNAYAFALCFRRVCKCERIKYMRCTRLE